jgi:hypothetical protein
MPLSTMPVLHFWQVGSGTAIGCISDEGVIAAAGDGYPQNYLTPVLELLRLTSPGGLHGKAVVAASRSNSGRSECFGKREEPIHVSEVPMVMTDKSSPFADYSLERGIALRWVLRDIRGKRLRLSPVSDTDLSTLTELGLVEMQDDVPVLTDAGRDALD